jgi:hypothetical protein
MESTITLLFLLEYSTIGMKINDLFLLTLMLLGVVVVACAGHVLIVPCVGFMLGFIGVVKSKSLPRFTNIGWKRGLFGPKDFEKSFRLIVLSRFMP